MGLKFRKSVKLGCGVRINFSSSGIGYSIGIKGFRTTISPHRRVTSRITIPGTGLYYTLGSKGRKGGGRPSHASQPSPETENIQIGLGVTSNTTSADITNFQPAEYDDLLKRLKIAYYSQMLAIILAIFGPCISVGLYDRFSFSPVIMYISIAAFLAVSIAILLLAVVDMDYNLDAESSENYNNYCASWDFVNTSRGKWQQITSTAVTDRKYHSGANTVVNLKPLTMTHRCPRFMRTNIDICCINMFSEKLVFLPDKLLIIRSGKIGAVNYDDIKISYSKRNITGAQVCSDSEIVGYTWKYVNRNGSPDKRFKDNKKLNICKCGEITLTSASGLNVIIVLSNNKVIDDLMK